MTLKYIHSESKNAAADLRMEKARDAALGNKSSRGSDALPIERYASGGYLTPVQEGFRCYSLGLTYEKPTTICAPNANSKVFGGLVDENNEIRAEFTKVSAHEITCDSESLTIIAGRCRSCRTRLRRSTNRDERTSQ